MGMVGTWLPLWEVRGLAGSWWGPGVPSPEKEGTRPCLCSSHCPGGQPSSLTGDFLENDSLRGRGLLSPWPGLGNARMNVTWPGPAEVWCLEVFCTVLNVQTSTQGNEGVELPVVS